MTRMIAALFAAAALTIGGMAMAMPVANGTVIEAPVWTVGSQWQYSDGYAVKVASVSAKGAVFERLDAPGQSFARQGFIRTDSISGTATRNAIYRTVPDAAGLTLSAGSPLTFQREYLKNGQLLVHASSWTVEGRETITVPAGTFDCFVIVWRTRSMRSDWTGFERWWYSPEARNYVRIEFKYGPGPESSRVLMRYDLAPATPVPVAYAAPEASGPMPTKISSDPVMPVQQPVEAAPSPPVKTRELPMVKDAPVEKAAAPNPPQPSAKVETAAKRNPVHERPAAQEPASEKPATVKARPVNFSTPQGNGKSGSWHAQVGSSPDAAGIRKSLDTILAANPQAQELPSGVVVRNIEARGTFYRAWIGSYESARDAQALCQSLKTNRYGCAFFKGATVQARAE